MSLMKSVYQAFINQGLSPNQARIITAEVGRENDFQPQYVFGRHVDASNGKVNLGMISWQGGRGAALDKRLRSKGLIGKNGIARSQAALNEMANFLIGEIKTNPAYEATKKAFLQNPNVSYDVGKKVLGQNFIRWDYSGKAVLGANVGKHHAKRDKYYRQLGGQGGTNYRPQQGGYQQQAPDPRLSMSAPELLANLRKSKDKRTELQMLYELSNNNGRAGREINALMAQGESLNDIASQLGLKVPSSAPQQPESVINTGATYDDYMASMFDDEPQAEPMNTGDTYDDYMASMFDSEPQQPQPPETIGDNYDDYMSYLTADEPTQAGDTWQTQNNELETTLSPKSARVLPTLKSSWESLS